MIAQVARATTTLSEDDVHLLRWLSSMPLLSPPELMVLANWARPTLHRAVNRLDREGLVSSLYASTPGTPGARRLYLTQQGVDALTSALKTPFDGFVERHPVSAHWLRLLLARLDAVVAVYRLVTRIAEVQPVQAFRWYRKVPLDAAVDFSSGRLGIIREGRMALPSHLGHRLRSLLRIPHPDAIVVIAPDPLRVVDWRRTLARMPFTATLAEEARLLDTASLEPIWYTPSDREPVALDAAVKRVRGGTLPVERPPRRDAMPPTGLQERAERLRHTGAVPPEDRYLYSVALRANNKRVLEMIALWPFIAAGDLADLMGVSRYSLEWALKVPLKLGVVGGLHLHGRVRLVLTDAGLSVLARRDRVSVQQVLVAWSPSPLDPAAPRSRGNLRGTRLRQLARQLDHTAGVHHFLAQMARDARALGHEMAVAIPSHRAQRHYASAGRRYTLSPDAYGRYDANGRSTHFFLEWEQRATTAAQFREKLTPYARYYRSRRPLEEFEEYPMIVAVVKDAASASLSGPVLHEASATGLLVVPMGNACHSRRNRQWPERRPAAPPFVAASLRQTPERNRSHDSHAHAFQPIKSDQRGSPHHAELYQRSAITAILGSPNCRPLFAGWPFHPRSIRVSMTSDARLEETVAAIFPDELDIAR